ncbi:Bro-N domain-containing protein [Pseudomonas sp. QL9]|uniref:BRO-N domain-containing protein n=1 Tax=Pseudomonas sp. QL9 TaxID=3242725 RepID=UPI003529ECF0
MSFIPSPSSESVLKPMAFVRNHRQLRAVLIDRQAWFVAADLARLTNSTLNERITNKLDRDQTRKAVLLNGGGQPERELLISESGVYMLLVVQLYHPENRELRQWLTNEVVPVLRDAELDDPALPRQRLGAALWRNSSVLEWQGELWGRLTDAIRVIESELFRNGA